MSKLTKQVSAPSILQEAAGAESALVSVSGDSFSSDTTVPVYSGDRLALWNQVFAEDFRSGSKTVNLTGRHDANVLSCVARAILLLQSRAKLSAEERDYIKETIEIILTEFEEVRIQFREDPDMVKKISDSLQSTEDNRRTRVGHITGIPVASSDLTSLVCRVQEKVAEETIRSIHTKSIVFKSNQDGSGSGFRSGTQEVDSGDE